jgi:hypothetical protein
MGRLWQLWTSSLSELTIVQIYSVEMDVGSRCLAFMRTSRCRYLYSCLYEYIEQFKIVLGNLND